MDAVAQISPVQRVDWPGYHGVRGGYKHPSEPYLRSLRYGYT